MLKIFWINYCKINGGSFARLSKKCSICIWDFTQTTFFYFERFLKKLADDQYSSITKGSIYNFKHVYIQPFTTVVDWPEIWCLMEVTTMFYSCRYCIFAYCGADIHKCSDNSIISISAHTVCGTVKYCSGVSWCKTHG